MTEFSVKIWGCRGSFPVSGITNTKYGGATSCVEVKVGKRSVILDAGTGITAAGHALNLVKNPRVYLFVTHAHFDHTLGLPYFNPMYRPDATVYIWGPRNSRFPSFEATVDALVGPPFHPVPLFEMLSKKVFADIGEADVVYFLKDEPTPLMLRPYHPDDFDKIPDESEVDFRVEVMRGYNHPKSGVNHYKVVAGDKSFVYATDTEGYVSGDRRLLKFAQDADLLIHDAMYTEERYVSMPVPTQGYGHSTVEIAAELARKANVKTLGLFHHDPTSEDAYLDEVGEFARGLFENSVVARDGLEFKL